MDPIVSGLLGLVGGFVIARTQTRMAHWRARAVRQRLAADVAKADVHAAARATRHGTKHGPRQDAAG